MSAPLKEFEFEQAKRALVAGGFTNARAIEILHTRMSLRDEFAIAALGGLVAKYALKDPGDQAVITQMAYELADSMLTQRQAWRDHHVLRREPA